MFRVNPANRFLGLLMSGPSVFMLSVIWNSIGVLIIQRYQTSGRSQWGVILLRCCIWKHSSVWLDLIITPNPNFTLSFEPRAHKYYFIWDSTALKRRHCTSCYILFCHYSWGPQVDDIACQSQRLNLLVQAGHYLLPQSLSLHMHSVIPCEISWHKKAN